MKQNIQDILNQNYLMFFHPGLPVSNFSPVQNLDQCVEISNHLINLFGRDFSQWETRHHDSIARIMNANWICQRLSLEPIKKPLLVHEDQGKYIVDCGDTRIMALDSVKDTATLSTLITVKVEKAECYHDWIPIRSNQDLFNVTKFDPNTATVLFTASSPNSDWCIDWFEIGDNSTCHHLHDISARVTMLQNWINTMPCDFKFDKTWITWPIDWAKFQST